MKIKMNNGRVDIDGRSFTGNCVQIIGNKVVVDGVTQDGELIGDISVVVHGDAESIVTGSGDVTANNVGRITTASGDVKCNDVSGSITTASGDVECALVHGNVSTMSGDVSKNIRTCN